VWTALYTPDVQEKLNEKLWAMIMTLEPVMVDPCTTIFRIVKCGAKFAEWQKPIPLYKML
jgi:hypothetical protein